VENGTIIRRPNCVKKSVITYVGGTKRIGSLRPLFQKSTTGGLLKVLLHATGRGGRKKGETIRYFYDFGLKKKTN